MLKRFLKYYKPHLKLLTLDMLAALTVSLLGIIYPIITRKMLNDLVPNRKYELIVAFGLEIEPAFKGNCDCLCFCHWAVAAIC